MARLTSFGNFRLLYLLTIFLFLPYGSRAGAEPVTIRATDGYMIKGDYRRPNSGKVAKAVVLLHMFRSSKESWTPLVRILTRNDIASLAIDMRGHGQSKTGPDGSDTSRMVIERDPRIFIQMYRDALAALQFLSQHEELSMDRLGLIGASVGCSVAVHANIKSETAPAATILLTPGKKYLGIDTMAHIKSWPGRPLLIVSSEEEKDKGAKAIYEKLRGEGAQLIIYDEEDIHGTLMLGDVDGVEEMIANWLLEKLELKKE